MKITLWHFISVVLVGACAYYVVPWAVSKLVYSKWWKRFWGPRNPKLVLAVLALLCVAAGPRIDNLKVRTDEKGCIFADFTLTGGDTGNYWLMWQSPEFIVPNMWIAVTRIEYAGTASYANVPLYTNFSCANLRLERIQ